MCVCVKFVLYLSWEARRQVLFFASPSRYFHLSANVYLIQKKKKRKQNSNFTMPPRKEPKEQVIYPSSRTKTPAFKPLRRIPTRESQPSIATKATPKTKTASSKAPTTSKSKGPIVLPDSEQEEESDDDLTFSTNKNASTSKPSGDGEENEEEEPHKKTTTKSAAPKRKASEISSLDSSTDHHHQQPPNKEPPTSLFLLSNEEEEEDLTTTAIPSIPQPLLLRLLHEGFHHKDTKIDTRALGMVQQYVEIFVREMIARCVAEKKERKKRKEKEKEKEDGDEGMRMDDDDDDDVGWLDLEDLEKVGVGMMLDF